MDRGSQEILRENLVSLDLSLERLLYSFNICNAIGLKEDYSNDDFIEFEAMTSRFARTTDMMINKVLRSLDTVEYLDTGTVIDAVNNAEKRGIADAQDLRRLKDLRNSIVHEYVTENIVRFFGKVLEFTPLLENAIKNLNNYCLKYV